MASTDAHTDVLTACQVLFGPDVMVSREFLAILHPSGVKAAFRRRARETHPDLHPADPDVQQRQARLFQELVTAYSRISGYFDHLPAVAPPPKPPVKPDASGPSSGPAREERSGWGSREGAFFRGPLPQRPMQIGRYLYYHRVIPYHALIESLTWQRLQRPAIGQLARDWGWLEDGDVIRVLRAPNCPGRFGERALALGLLNGFQVRQLLRSQQASQRRLGEFFILNGYLTPRQLGVLLSRMQQHNASLAES